MEAEVVDSAPGYVPKRGLRMALKDWIMELYKTKSVQTSREPADKPLSGCDSVTRPVEPMETNGSTEVPDFTSAKDDKANNIICDQTKPKDEPSSSADSTSISIAQTESGAQSNCEDKTSPKQEAETMDTDLNKDCSKDIEEVEVEEPEDNGPLNKDSAKKSNSKSRARSRHLEELGQLELGDLLILCDLFYLPFEHGPYAVHLLKKANWLLNNVQRLQGFTNCVRNDQVCYCAPCCMAPI
jgi:protein O-GlcNAcase/histone acetyltransferase